MIYVQEKKVIISYDEKLESLVTKWIGSCSFEEIKEGNLKGLELIKEKKVSRWLIDNRQTSAMSDEAIEWLNTVLTPMAIKEGLRQVGLVVPLSIFNQIATENITTEIKELGFTLKNFGSLQEAREWLYDGK